MFGRHHWEPCCVLPTHHIWVCLNWLPRLRKPPGAESCYLTVLECLTESTRVMGAAQLHDGERLQHRQQRCPSADGLCETIRAETLMLQQLVRAAPERASNSRVAVGKGTGRGHRPRWGGRNRGEKVSSNLIAEYNLVGSIC